MKRIRTILCAAAFVLICVLTFLFLQSFAAIDDNVFCFLNWQSASQVNEDGTLTSYDPNGEEVFNGLTQGKQYRFTAAVDGAADGSYLILETIGAEMTLRLDGEEIYRSASVPSYAAETVIGTGQVQIPLPKNANGKTIELDYRLISSDGALYPPLLRVSSLDQEGRFNTAYANHYGIPAGAFGLLFVILCGIFFLGLTNGMPDRPLPLLMLATGVLTAYQITVGSDYAFLPTPLHRFLTWSGFALIAPAALLLYLLLNRNRSFRRYLGKISLCSGALLLIAYLISSVKGSYLSQYIRDMASALFKNGSYIQPLYWLTIYLIFICAALSVFSFARASIRMHAETLVAAMKNDAIMENYHAVEEKLQQTAFLRHEWKNQITALNLIYQEGNIEEIGNYLNELDERLDGLAPQKYTEHFIVNCILQNTAFHAEEKNIVFRPTVLIPADLKINDSDLCILLFNVLDNALEAAVQVPPPKNREIVFSIRLTQGFLAIDCENTYIGEPRTDGHGNFYSTKDDSSKHGFGLSQIRRTVDKYHGILDISYTDDLFKVQAALKIKTENGNKNSKQKKNPPAFKVLQNS